MKRCVALALLFATSARADEYRVGPGGYASLQAAVDAAMSGASRNQSGNAVIRLPSGVWKGAMVAGATPNAGGNIGRSYLEIRGAPDGTTIVRDSSVQAGCGTVVATNSASVLLRGVTLETDKSNGCQSAIFAQNGATIQVGEGVVFGPASKQHMHAEAHGVIEVSSDYRVVGSAEQHWAVSTGGLILIDPKPLAIRFDGPVRFEHFAWAQSTGVILVGAGRRGQDVRFVGLERVTARYRYVVQSNAVIDLNGGKQALPGVAVLATTGGQYVNGP